MKAGIFVSCWLSFPKILSSTKLTKVLCSLRADVFEEFKGYPAYLLFIGVQIEEDHWIILTADDASHLL